MLCSVCACLPVCLERRLTEAPSLSGVMFPDGTALKCISEMRSLMREDK